VLAVLPPRCFLRDFARSFSSSIGKWGTLERDCVSGVHVGCDFGGKRVREEGVHVREDGINIHSADAYDMAPKELRPLSIADGVVHGVVLHR
jgi:hypothetical protein